MITIVAKKCGLIIRQLTVDCHDMIVKMAIYFLMLLIVAKESGLILRQLTVDCRDMIANIVIYIS